MMMTEYAYHIMHNYTILTSGYAKSNDPESVLKAKISEKTGWPMSSIHLNKGEK